MNRIPVEYYREQMRNKVETSKSTEMGGHISCDHPNLLLILLPFLIHHPSLDCIILHNRISPTAELHSPLIINLEADSNNHLEIIMIDGPRNSTRAFILNY